MVSTAQRVQEWGFQQRNLKVITRYNLSLIYSPNELGDAGNMVLESQDADRHNFTLHGTHNLIAKTNTEQFLGSEPHIGCKNQD